MSFDIAQYTIEVSMENGSQPQLYPDLEEVVSLADDHSLLEEQPLLDDQSLLDDEHTLDDPPTIEDCNEDDDDKLYFKYDNKPMTFEGNTDDEPWNRWLFSQLKNVLDSNADKIAIVEEVGETRCISYCELMDGVMKTVSYLHHHGVTEGTVVGFCMESSFEFILYELATFFLGAMPVLFHPSHIASDRVTRLKVCIMIVDAEHYGHVLRSFEYFTDLEKIFVLADDLASIYVPRNVWVLDGLGFLDFPCKFMDLGKSPGNVVAFATSGTSSSKGKIVAHGADSCKIISTLYYTELSSLLREKDPEQNSNVHLVSSGLHTIDGFSYSIYSLIHGATLVVTETNADIWKVSFLDRVAGLIERYQIPMLMVHSQFLKCFSKYEIDKIYNVSSLKLLCHSGSPLPPSVITSLKELGITTTQSYISTEVGPFSLEQVSNSEDLITCCGEPFLGNETKILEMEGANEVEPGKWGRLCVQGPTLFANYLCEAKFTESCSGRWFFTGDIAMIDEQARLFVAGPAEGVVTVEAEVIPLASAENVLIEISTVEDAAVAKVKDDYVCAIVLKEGEVPPSVEEINKKLAEKSIPFTIASTVVVDFVPRSETGKLLRSELPFLLEAEAQDDVQDFENNESTV